MASPLRVTIPLESDSRQTIIEKYKLFVGEKFNGPEPLGVSDLRAKLFGYESGLPPARDSVEAPLSESSRPASPMPGGGTRRRRRRSYRRRR